VAGGSLLLAPYADLCCPPTPDYATEAGHSIAEEIRLRLIASFAREEPTGLNRLLDDVARLADLVGKQTGAEWNVDPVAARILRAAIATRLKLRYGAQDNLKFSGAPADEIGRDIEYADYSVTDAIENHLWIIDQRLEEMRDTLAKAGIRRPELEEIIRSLEKERNDVRRRQKRPHKDIEQEYRRERVFRQSKEGREH
jgi:hypothetical protein